MRVDAVPTPFWVLRHHAPASVHWVGFANNGRLLVAGDAEGRVSVTSLVDFRPRLFWKAHSDTVLRADAWAGFLVTHGRDHCVRVWTMPDVETAAQFVSGNVGTATSASGDAGSGESQESVPPLAMSVPVNALNYCAYDMALSDKAPKSTLHGWIAVPHTLDAAFIDVYALPAQERVFEAIGRDTNVTTPGAARRPIVMSVKLLQSGLTSAELCVLAAYEDGSVQLWALHVEDRSVSLAWSHASHREMVTALALDPDGKHAFSVGADDLIAMHALGSDQGSAPKSHATRHPGNACAAVRMDGHILAVGGWDNVIRVYALPDMQALAALRYHRESVYSLAFVQRQDAVHALPDEEEGSEESDEESRLDTCISLRGAPLRSASLRTLRLLAAGGKDGRISLWDPSFTSGDSPPWLQ